MASSPPTTETAEPPPPGEQTDAVARVGKFLFTIAQSDELPNDDVRVRALTNWLRHHWESDQREETRVEVSTTA